MVKKMMLSVSDDLHAKMMKFKDSFNFSKVFQKAISNEIEKKELFQFKLDEEKSIQEILEEGNYDTPAGQYQTGQEFGFAYAKTLKYHELKPYEQYVEGWNKRDQEIMERIYYDLNILSIFHELGLIDDQNENEENINFEEQDVRLGNDFDVGFLDGLMEFIQEECSLVKIGKIALERDKEMFLVKDNDERMKIFLKFRDKIMAAK